jgi:hypothetical protein
VRAFSPNSTKPRVKNSRIFTEVCYHDSRYSSQLQIEVVSISHVTNTLIVRSTTQKAKSLPFRLMT